MKPAPRPARNRAHGHRPLIGAHFSIAKGLHHALYTAADYGCGAVQLFTKNATTWKERLLKEEEIALFDRARRESGISVIASHASYLINIASPDKKKHAMSARALKEELVRCARLKIPYCVLHPGAHMGEGCDAGLRRISRTIDDILDQVPGGGTLLLLETTAGQGSGIGRTFEQLAQIVGMVEHREHVGVCLDTCHIFAAGYDIRTAAAYGRTIDAFISLLGIHRLHVIHCNDAKKGLHSRVDRHEHIGRGLIGTAAFKHLLNDERLLHVPKILETPKGEKNEDWDRRNLETLRRLCRR